jgi:signal transduction histidine kinase
LGVLTAGVAHEINNPINVVHVGVQNMANELTNFKKPIFELAADDAEEAILDSFRRQLKPMYQHLKTIKRVLSESKPLSTIYALILSLMPPSRKPFVSPTA